MKISTEALVEFFQATGSATAKAVAVKFNANKATAAAAIRAAVDRGVLFSRGTVHSGDKGRPSFMYGTIPLTAAMIGAAAVPPKMPVVRASAPTHTSTPASTEQVLTRKDLERAIDHAFRTGHAHVALVEAPEGKPVFRLNPVMVRDAVTKQPVIKNS